MLNNIYTKGTMFLCGLLLVVSSCTEDFEDINTNPNGPTTVPSSLLVATVVEATMDRLYSTFVGGDMGNTWAQLWSKVQYNDEERYNPRGSILDAIWNNLYARSLQDIDLMEKLAIDEGNS